jgi:hypothetical protein
LANNYHCTLLFGFFKDSIETKKLWLWLLKLSQVLNGDSIIILIFARGFLSVSKQTNPTFNIILLSFKFHNYQIQIWLRFIIIFLKVIGVFKISDFANIRMLDTLIWFGNYDGFSYKSYWLTTIKIIYEFASHGWENSNIVQFITSSIKKIMIE